MFRLITHKPYKKEHPAEDEETSANRMIRALRHQRWRTCFAFSEHTSLIRGTLLSNSQHTVHGKTSRFAELSQLLKQFGVQCRFYFWYHKYFWYRRSWEISRTSEIFNETWYTCKDMCRQSYSFSLLSVAIRQIACKAIPVQTCSCPEISKSLRLPDFKTVGTWWW